jgi:hypothetical protein
MAYSGPDKIPSSPQAQAARCASQLMATAPPPRAWNSSHERAGGSAVFSRPWFQTTPPSARPAPTSPAAPALGLSRPRGARVGTLFCGRAPRAGRPGLASPAGAAAAGTPPRSCCRARPQAAPPSNAAPAWPRRRLPLLAVLAPVHPTELRGLPLVRVQPELPLPRHDGRRRFALRVAVADVNRSPADLERALPLPTARILAHAEAARAERLAADQPARLPLRLHLRPPLRQVELPGGRRGRLPSLRRL